MPARISTKKTFSPQLCVGKTGLGSSLQGAELQHFYVGFTERHSLRGFFNGTAQKKAVGQYLAVTHRQVTQDLLDLPGVVLLRLSAAFTNRGFPSSSQ